MGEAVEGIRTLESYEIIAMIAGYGIGGFFALIWTVRYDRKRRSNSK